MKETLKIFDAFYGGIQKGDKPNIAGAVSNIEEVDISNTPLSAAWIKATYNSGNNSLVSYGAEEGMDNAIFFGINL